jgi:hypothetical protein
MNTIGIGIVAVLVGLMIGFVIFSAAVLRHALRSAHRPPTPLPAAFSAIGSAVLLFAAIGTGIYSAYFLSASTATSGAITAIHERKDSDGDAVRYPVYQYQDANGAEHRGTTSMSVGREVVVGDVIPVRYLRKSPAQSRIDTFSHHWFVSLFFLVACLIAATVAGVLGWNYKRERVEAGR